MKAQDSFKIDFIPKRIISLVPSQTELLVDLGLQDNIVGITKFCVHPEHLKKEKAIVGGTKQVDFDKIRSLNPDIVLCNKEENTKAMVLELERFAPVHVSDIKTIEDCLSLIHLYGKIFNVEERVEIIINEIVAQQLEFKNYIKSKPKLKVAYFIWQNPYMVATNDTFINELLVVNHFENVFSDLERYPEIIPNASNEQPNVVLLSSEPFPFKEKHINEFQKLYPNSKVVLVDGENFSWFGSRLINAFKYFTNLRENLQ